VQIPSRDFLGLNNYKAFALKFRLLSIRFTSERLKWDFDAGAFWMWSNFRFWSYRPSLSLPKTLSAHPNALTGNLIADRDQLEAAESKIGKCK
jgi:hypothetical protein